MSSPFSIFRRNQRILMVVATALSIISFVFLGAISDPREMPPLLVAILFTAMLGGAFWLAGLRKGKAADWGLTGTVLGLVLALAMIWSGRESAAVTFDGGKLTNSEVTELINQRRAANHFVQMAASASIPTDGDEGNQQEEQFKANQRIRENSFGFVPAEQATTEDIILGELLRREADRMGIVISDEIVLDFMKSVSGNNLTKSAFAEIRRTLGVSESTLMDMLREEIKAREAGKLLNSQTYLTPENHWEFYKKLNVKQSAEIVAVPVSSFVTDSMQPSDAELQTLLDQYRQNIPGYTPEGRPQEGLPGFYQLPKYQVAYLEAVFDDIKETVGEVSEEEIQQRYQTEYVDDVAPELPEEMKAPIESSSTPPALPPLEKETESEKEATEKPKAEETDSEASETETPESKEKPTEETQPEESGTQETTEEDSDSVPDESGNEETEEPARENEAQSFNEETLKRLQFVSFQDEAAEETASEEEKDQPEPAPLAAPLENEKAEEGEDKPAEKKDDSPVEEKPAEEKESVPAETSDSKPEEAASEESEMKKPEPEENVIPPAPTSDVPELTDELKEEIRQDILRERTQQKIALLMKEANGFVSVLAEKYRRGEFEEDEYISLEEATKQIKAYAKGHNLEYIETPFLTLTELRTSEDYPVGSALVQSSSGSQTVVQQLQQSIPSILFNVNRANRFNFDEFGGFTNSTYVYWKKGYQKDYAPKTIDDEPSVRQQVVKAWKQQQADETAKKRAEELAKLVETSDKPMGEALSDETVTGNPESLFLTVQNTGEFTMMTQGAAPSTNPFQQPQQGPPRLSSVAGAPDAGERFFKTVFDELDVEEAGVAPNQDGSVYYVVKIKDRKPSSPDQMKEMRENFLNQGFQMPYYYMGSSLLSQYSSDWRTDLLEKYDVQFAVPENDDQQTDES